MTTFLQYVAGGLASGSLYALVALGIVLLYRTSRVLNFAHGDIATFGAFVAYGLLVGSRLPFALAAPLAVVVAAAVGVAFYGVILRRIREPTLLGTIVMTLGLSLLLNGVVVGVWGTDTKVLPFPLSDTTVYRFAGVAVSQTNLGTLAAGFALMGGMYLLVQHTRVGLAMRAVSQDAAAAQTLGIPVRRVIALAWALASGLGAAAGILVAPVAFLDPFAMLEPFLKGFAGAVVGGIDSMPGAVAGGLLLGVVESVFGGYVSVEFKTTLAFVVIVVVLLVRPQGIFGREFRRRV